jgi:hypothetical protein
MSERAKPASESASSSELREALWRLLFARRTPAPELLETMSAPAFRAVVAERLRSLERDVAEVRARVNGLLFVVAGAVVTQVVLRMFG